MIAYILKSISCLALLLFFYHFILEKEKMHNFNRFYLMGAVLFSFLVPLTTIEITPEVIPETISVVQSFEEPINFENTTPIIIEETFNYTQLFIGLYCFISLIFLIRFGRNIYKILYKINVNKKVKHLKATLVLVDDKILPHTFWSYIFINKEEYFDEKIEEELFTHELTHVTQKHTLDVLIIELLQVVFWINPLFILLKKAIQLNHEFLADETVINQHKNTTQYQHLLLNKAAWNNEYYLASNLNYSLTKKRLEMMTTQSSQTKVLLKKLAVIPLLTGFIFLFAERVEAQETIKEEPRETIVEQVSKESKKLSESEIYKEYFHSKGHFIFKDKNGKKISKKYSELSKEEKKRMIPPPPLKSKKKIPTQELIEKLKDGEKYAIWIDDKVVKNDVLDNYKSSDFSSHFVSFVYKNARSKRFPQNYQAHLSTHKHFDNQNEKRVNDFKEYLKKEYKVEEVVETPKKKKPLYIDSPIKKQNSKQSISFNTNEVLKLEDLNKIAHLFSPLEEYNTLAKKYNAIPVEKRIIKLKDLNKLESLYKQISIEEKKNAQPFPEYYLPNKKNSLIELRVIKNTKSDTLTNKFHKNWFITIDGIKYYYTFDKKERVARYYKNNKLVNLDIVKEYNKKHKIFESLKSKGEHYVFKSGKEKSDIDREFSDLGGMYFRMPRANKNKVPYPKNPIKPYLALRKNNKEFYKLRKDLTEEDKLLIPPPPPNPNASREEIQKAKKAYEAWKKRTGNDFAPLPPKKN